MRTKKDSQGLSRYAVRGRPQRHLAPHAVPLHYVHLPFALYIAGPGFPTDFHSKAIRIDPPKVPTCRPLSEW